MTAPYEPENILCPWPMGDERYPPGHSLSREKVEAARRSGAQVPKRWTYRLLSELTEDIGRGVWPISAGSMYRYVHRRLIIELLRDGRPSGWQAVLSLDVTPNQAHFLGKRACEFIGQEWEEGPFWSPVFIGLGAHDMRDAEELDGVQLVA